MLTDGRRYDRVKLIEGASHFHVEWKNISSIAMGSRLFAPSYRVKTSERVRSRKKRYGKRRIVNIE